MSSRHVEIRQGSYHDSVTLLQVSKTLADLAGVEAAQVAMATPLNLDVLAQMGFELPVTNPDDLVVALRLGEQESDRASALENALHELEQALSRRGAGSDASSGQQDPPRTTGAALRRQHSPLVLISVPGQHAAAEAWDALDAGASVMLFSDNVSVEDEVALKTVAAQRGLLVMGPDCGTAVVGGVGLGFATVVRPGPVSLVAASGTGAQHLMALLDAAGVGVRHCLGLGGRDLTSAVGGLGARQALTVLAADPGTELVVLVSKPADPTVVRELTTFASEVGIDLLWALIGQDQPDLTHATEEVLAHLGVAVPQWPVWGERATGPGTTASAPRLLRGLFAGGTLCDEAMAIAAARLGPVASNIPLPQGGPALDASGPGALARSLAEAGHAVVDLGDDTLTVGRAHPMIDPSLRLEALSDAASDSRVRVVLLDVVLGHGAHADPAAAHVPAIRQALEQAAAQGRSLDVVVTLLGTTGDPQGLDRQAEALAAAGARVFASNAQATRAAIDCIQGQGS